MKKSLFESEAEFKQFMLLCLPLNVYTCNIDVIVDIAKHEGVFRRSIVEEVEDDYNDFVCLHLDWRQKEQLIHNQHNVIQHLKQKLSEAEK